MGDHPSKRSTWGCAKRGRVAHVPLLILLRVEVYLAGAFKFTAGALLPHPFNLTCAGNQPSAVYSLLHLSSSRLGRPLAGTLPYGAPTFLDAELLQRRGHPAGSSPHFQQGVSLLVGAEGFEPP